MPENSPKEYTCDNPDCTTVWYNQYDAATCCVECSSCHEWNCIKCGGCYKCPADCTCCKTCGKSWCQCCPQCGNPCICCCNCTQHFIHCPNCGHKKYLGPGKGCAYCGFEKYDHKKNPAVVAKSSERDVAQRYGLDMSVNLPQLCADYYLYQNMWQISKMGRAYKALTRMAERWAPEFATYLDIACGGELRHANTANAKKRGVEFEPHPVGRGSARGMAWDGWAQWKTPIERLEYASQVFYYGHKLDASTGEWVMENWYNDDRRYSDLYVTGGGYGGPKWGNIADATLLYLKQEVSPIQFLDRIWNLEHNGGCAFNKVYQWGNATLRQVLNAHGQDNISLLLQHASKECSDMWALCEAWVSGDLKKRDPDLHLKLQREALGIKVIEQELKWLGLDRATLSRQLLMDEEAEEEQRKLMLEAAEAKKRAGFKKTRSLVRRKAIVENYQRDVFLANTLGTGDYTPPLNRAINPDWKGGKDAKATTQQEV